MAATIVYSPEEIRVTGRYWRTVFDMQRYDIRFPSPNTPHAAGLALCVVGIGFIVFPLLVTLGCRDYHDRLSAEAKNAPIVPANFPHNVLELARPTEPLTDGDYVFSTSDFTKPVKVRAGTVNSVNGLFHVVSSSMQVGSGPILRLVDAPRPPWGERLHLVNASGQETAVVTVTLLSHPITAALERSRHGFTEISVTTRFVFPQPADSGSFVNVPVDSISKIRFFSASPDEIKLADDIRKYENAKKELAGGFRPTFLPAFLCSMIGGTMCVFGWRAGSPRIRDVAVLLEALGLVCATTMVLLIIVCGGALWYFGLNHEPLH